MTLTAPSRLWVSPACGIWSRKAPGRLRGRRPRPCSRRTIENAQNDSACDRLAPTNPPGRGIRYLGQELQSAQTIL